MAHRNFSMVEYFNRRVRDWQPQLSFTGSTEKEWAQWRHTAHAKYMELLGTFPDPVDPAPEIVYSIVKDDLIEERVIFDSEEYMSVPCTVLRRVDMPPTRQGRAIVCCHGHGPFGKEPIAGNATTQALRDNIAMHHYNYGEEMARHGFMTLCPDLRAHIRQILVSFHCTAGHLPAYPPQVRDGIITALAQHYIVIPGQRHCQYFLFVEQPGV